MSEAPTRHAFVTGAGSGIGAAIARTLHRQGLRVTLAGRDIAKLQQVAVDLNGAFVTKCDVTNLDSVQAAFNHARWAHGPISVLVNNAGIAPSGPFADVAEKEWKYTLDVNVNGAFRCAQAALPDMEKLGWGRIVSIASTAGLKGYPYVSAYCASKHALIGFTRALALEVARKGVTVNAVCPGFTDTEIVNASALRISEKTGDSQSAARARLAAFNPQGRLVEPAEVASTAAWLCSEDAAAINGATISVSGGEV